MLRLLRLLEPKWKQRQRQLRQAGLCGASFEFHHSHLCSKPAGHEIRTDHDSGYYMWGRK